MRPQARLAARKKAKMIKHKYLNLTMRLKRGRAKADWKYRNRVGQKAESFRKVHLTLFCLTMHVYASHMSVLSVYKTCLSEVCMCMSMYEISKLLV